MCAMVVGRRFAPLGQFRITFGVCDGFRSGEAGLARQLPEGVPYSNCRDRGSCARRAKGA